MTDISVILPTYNEVDNIVPMIEAVNGALIGYDAEIIVVDDDSPDGTSACVEAVLEKFDRLRLITRKTDKGLVNAIGEGIKNCRGEICLWMDADLSMPTNKIPDLIEQINNGADLAVGSRYVEGGGIKGSAPHVGKTGIFHVWNNLRDTEDSFIAVAISKYGNLFASLVLDRRYHDYTSGFYAVRKDVIKDVGLEGEYLDYCIILLYKAAVRGWRIIEAPVRIVPRKSGKSKTSNNPFALIPLVLKCTLKIIHLKLTVRKRV